MKPYNQKKKKQEQSFRFGNVHTFFFTGNVYTVSKVEVPTCTNHANF